MKTKSRASEKRLNPKRRMVQKSASELTPPSARDLERLRRAMEEDIDTSEIPERWSGRAVRTQRPPEESQGAAPGSAIRDAIRRELGRRQITRYELWKRARAHETWQDSYSELG